VNEADFASRLTSALRAAGVSITDNQLERLVRYWRLLAKWNSTVNLTSLPLHPPDDTTINRLFLEPLIANAYFPTGARMWFDLGSGGGSPAIPLKVLRPDVSLVMVEVRTRKAAFLSEVVRALDLNAVEVLVGRFEEVCAQRPHSADIVTARAIRPDAVFTSSVRKLLKPLGTLLSFQSDKSLHLEGLREAARHRLGSSAAELVLYVPRGTTEG
jgi:16S rRNA (guanine527-N7)-methyltransferase